MLPLRATDNVTKFPITSLVIIVLIILLDFFGRLWPSWTHVEFNQYWAPVPYYWNPALGVSWIDLLMSCLLFESLFSAWIACLYLWAFTPRLFEKRSKIWVFVASLLSVLFSFFCYREYQGPSAQAPVLLALVWVSALLGISMRSEIWSTVSTFVFGPKILQIYEVPSYVLLFFWFFYLMIGNLIMASPFSDAPNLYFLPLMAFMGGFLLESLALIVMKHNR